jgi:aspartyl-tRNA(Asn)/glutamyl-tRNA(Gln) amidotransferase subunit C
MISKKEVQRIAKLARLDLNEKEIRRFQKELYSILDYVGKLKKIDPEICELASTKHLLAVENIMREDEARRNGASAAKAKKLLELASQTENGYLKVKSILK